MVQRGYDKVTVKLLFMCIACAIFTWPAESRPRLTLRPALAHLDVAPHQCRVRNPPPMILPHIPDVAAARTLPWPSFCLAHVNLHFPRAIACIFLHIALS